MNDNRIQHISIQKIDAGKLSITEDMVAVEEPLEIQLEYSTQTGLMRKNIAVTMRTPGNDDALAAGFLFTEGIISDYKTIKEIKHPAADENQLLIVLRENIQPNLSSISRNFYSTSSCGICGKASIEAIRTVSQYANKKDEIIIEAAVFNSLQELLKQQQKVFEDTGGIHAAALFDFNGNFITLREDVGRHNAMDKIIGQSLLNNVLPLNNCILLLSGRASFELIQKAAMAGIKIVAAVGAPSSLAVEMAKEMSISLIGFLRNDRFNIYSGEQRIKTL